MTNPSTTFDFFLNGEQHSLPEGATVAALVESLGRHPQTVAVELNREILPRDRYQQTALGPGDRIEIVHFVQGG